MNKKILLAAMAIGCLAVNNVLAQEPIKLKENSDKGFYLKIGGGYSFEAGRASVGNELIPAQNVSANDIITITGAVGDRQSTTTSSTKITDAAFSLGGGINISAGLGYMLTKNIGIELGANYLMGSKTTFTHEYILETRHNYSETIGSVTYMGGGYVRDASVTEVSISRNYLSLSPAIKLVAPLGDKTSLYSRFGIVVPIMDKVDLEYHGFIRSTSTRPTQESESSSGEKAAMEFTSYFNIGYTSAIGIQYNIGKVGLYAEVNHVTSSFQVKKGKVTKLDQYDNPHNGTPTSTSLLEDMDTCDKESDFLKEYVVTNNDPAQSSDKPSKEASFTLPASSLGIAVGVVFKF